MAIESPKNRTIQNIMTNLPSMKQRILFILLCGLFFLPLIAFGADKTIKTNSPAHASGEYASVEERRLLLALQQERQNLAQEKESVKNQKKALKRLEAEVDKKLAQLQTTREQIEKLLKEKDAKKIQKIRDLSKMYEKMPAENAARILSTLQEDLAVAILEKMKTKAAARVLSSMNKDKAVQLTTAFSSP